MKHISVDIDWLATLDGGTVAQAIAYLQTLDPTHQMTYWQSSGDCHGVEISSNLSYLRAYTAEEQAAETQRRKDVKIRDLNQTVAYYEGVLAREGPAYRGNREDMHTRIAAAKAELEKLK